MWVDWTGRPKSPLGCGIHNEKKEGDEREVGRRAASEPVHSVVSEEAFVETPL